MNFLQGHYNQIRKAGGSSAEYAAVNDVSDEVAAELEAGYQVARGCALCRGLGFKAVGDEIIDCRCWKKYLLSEGRDR